MCPTSAVLLTEVARVTDGSGRRIGMRLSGEVSDTVAAQL